MKVINAKSIKNTQRHVTCPKGGFSSLRFLLQSDGLGFTLTETTIYVGGKQRWHYKNHLEACYCVEGLAVLKNEHTKDIYLLKPGSVYILDKHEPHTFTALEEVKLVCVFNPPLKGREVHREDGSYEV